MPVGAMVALAYPDRVAARRPGAAPRYLTSGGKGAVLPPGDALAGLAFLAVAETDGHPQEARIRSAAALTGSEVRDVFADRVEAVALCTWSSRAGRVTAVRQERLGALVLAERPWRDAPPEAATAAMLKGVRELGLRWSDKGRRFADRVRWARAAGADLPDMSEEALMAALDGWLAPHLAGVSTADQWRTFDLLPALEAMLDWPQRQALDAVAPAAFTTPLGRSVPINYADEGPEIAVRLQELFGVTRHPGVAGRPLRVTLLSPAGRPLQVTADLPGFWATSYAEVRREMRGRYPKHPWPEDPTAAEPTLRTKRRG